MVAATGEDILLPPPYRLVELDGGEAFPYACAAATDGADAGTLVWARRPDRFDCAVVLEPEAPLAQARAVVYVALLALGDALAALGPPSKPVGYVWPDGVAVDGASVGGVRLAMPPNATDDDVPDRMVIGAAVRIAFDAGDDSPGRDAGRTALREEGFGDVDAAMLVECYSRYLLSWMNNWEEDGFQPLAEAWLRRLMGGREGEGVKHGLDANGDLLVLDGKSSRPRRRSLAAALTTPGWSL